MKIISALCLVILMVFLTAVLGGTFIWILYPHIHALFPSAVVNNVISESLSWWDSVCISWLIAILKGNLSVSGKTEK